MAKYVLLAFDDDAQADAFVKTTQENGLVVNEGESVFKFYVPLIRAVFKRPTLYCTCKYNKNDRGFTRGKKYGWWVHSCGKPTKAWARGEHWFLSLGKNLLPVTPQAPEYRGTGVFGNHFKPCDVCGTRLSTEIGHADAKVWCGTCGEWK